jgi:hypothetical protein
LRLTPGGASVAGKILLQVAARDIRQVTDF